MAENGQSDNQGGQDRFLTQWFGTGESPMHAAQKGLKPELPVRFYKTATAVERDGLHALVLDGKPARTPTGTALAVASHPLGQAIAAEWAAQGQRIDPSTMPVTRLVNTAIDGVSQHASAVADEIVRYAGSDLLCYRADEPERLVHRQHEAWDPLLAWAAEALQAPLATTSGIIFAAQPASSIAAIDTEVRRFEPLGLAALHVMTTLTGSAVLALAVALGHIEAEAAWAAAHVDEDFQIELWGEDAEAQARRANRWREMEAAARVLSLAASG